MNDSWQIVGEIGAGGTGVIYKAYHLRLQKYVVIKKIRENVAGQLNVRAETDILKELHHSYLPQVYDFFQIGSDVYSVMEYIEGYDLKQYMESGYFFTEEELVRWLKELADVLEYLHTRIPPIIHSDIKPANIMITSDGDVCLIDFNIALTGEGMPLLGISKYYSSPEQTEIALARGRSPLEIDARTDIYSLGATFYYLMTGCLPGEDSGEILPLESFDLPYSDGLIGLVGKMMEPERNRRYASAEALSHALDHLERQGKRCRQLKVAIAGIAAAVVILLSCVIALAVTMQNSSKRQAYVAAYNTMVEAYEEGDYSGALSDGLEILNRSSWQKYLSEDGDTKGAICRMIADVYLENGNPQTACTYYKMAIDCGVTDVSLYKDYAMALAQAGDISEAQGILEQAQAEGLSDADSHFILAQILYQSGDYSGAAQEFISCLESDTDMTNRELRQTANFGVTLANKLDDGSGLRSRLLWEAADLFGRVIDSGLAIQSDYFNLAVVYTELSEYGEVRDTLLALMDQPFYQDDYKSWALLAQAYYQLAVASGEYDPDDVSKMRACCENAIELAEAAGVSEDSYTEIAEYILNLLKSSGG